MMSNCFSLAFFALFAVLTFHIENAQAYGAVQYNTMNVAPGQVKLSPPECQRHQVTSFNMDAALRNCHGSRDARVEAACIKLCGLHARAILLPGGLVSESGIDMFVHETYPYWTWERIKHGIKVCSGLHVEDGNDMTCLKSKRYLDCFENVANYICGESPPVVLPPHPMQQQIMMQAAPPPPSGLFSGIFGGMGR